MIQVYSTMEWRLLFVFVLSVSCQVLGGWNSIDVTSIPDIVVKAAKDKLTAENKAFNTFVIVSAKEQVISGWNYQFDVNIDHEKCHFFIFYKWDWTTTVRDFHCSPLSM